VLRVQELIIPLGVSIQTRMTIQAIRFKLIRSTIEMQKEILFIFLLSMLSLGCFGQSEGSENDSLFAFELDQIQNAGDGPAKLKGARRLFHSVQNGHFQKTPFAFSLALNTQAQLLVQNNRADSALILIQRYLKQFKSGKDISQLGRMYHQLALLSFRQDLLFSTHLYLDSAIFYAKESRDELARMMVEELYLKLYLVQVKTDAVLGRIKIEEGFERDSIAKNAILAQIFDELQMSILSSVAEANIQSGSIRKAISLLSDAEELADNLNLHKTQIDIWIKLAHCNLKLNRLRTAEAYLGSALKEVKKEGWLEQELQIDIYRSELLRRRKRPERALSILSDRSAKISSLQNLQIKKEFFEAKASIFSSLELSDSAESNSNKAKIVSSRMLEKAWENERAEWKMHLQIDQNLELLQVQEKLKSEKSRNSFSEETQLIYQLSIMVCLLLLLILIVGWIVSIQSKKKKLRASSSKIQDYLAFQKQFIESVVQNIRAHSMALEIGPQLVLSKLKSGKIHEAYGLLSSLESEYQSLDHQLTGFIKECDPQIFKTLLNDTSEVNIQAVLVQELKNQSILTKELGIEIQLEIEAEEALNTKSMLLALVFRNLLFNSLQHSNATEIRIKVWIEKSELKLKLSDNGIGISTELIDYFKSDEIEKPTSIGFGFWLFKFIQKETNDRLEVMSVKEGTAFILSIAPKH